MGLGELGFGRLAERVYRAMIEEPDLDVTGLAQAVDAPAVDVRAELSVLVELGAARIDPAGAAGVALLHPAAAIGDLIERTEDELLARFRRVGDTRAELVELSARYARRPSSAVTTGVERLDTAAEVRDAVAELTFFARTSVHMVRPGPVDREQIQLSRRSDLRAVCRGIDLRGVYDRDVLGKESSRSHLRELNAAGAHCRVAQHPLEQMMIFDERVAIVPVDPRCADRGSLMVRQAGLLGGFVQLFHRIWADADEVGEHERAADPELTEADQRALRLLASGSTDETAARAVGVSVRQLRRRVARLMERLGAASRFEAGVQASRRGWI